MSPNAARSVSAFTFHPSFVYAFNSVLGKRPFWQNLMDFNSLCSSLWIFIGDLNCVLRAKEKINGANITPYETKDLFDCYGLVTTYTNRVVGEFIRYFEDLLGFSKSCDLIDLNVLRSRPCISTDQTAFLSSNISCEEIKSTLFSIGDEKASGLDGYSACFFKKAWLIMDEQFTEAIHEFFSSGFLLKQLNHSVIFFVLKSKHANTVGEFRRIAYCNVAYKSISKVLASRLTAVLPSIIDHAQFALVKGMSLMANVHLAQELLCNYNHKRISPRCLIKVDLCKTFDICKAFDS
ncbi:uncharacterized protein LOC127791637 [Diospyros lotus]|uniref:uncharacterized protein LOC127791637 n=1 Tax=Diospyros lotus TaxID=55363 RepID=UPI00225025DF|nr:uncharacterized protein LOC127791637 [Diospyros lotus]